MSERRDLDTPQPEEYLGYYENGVIRLTARTSWPDGTPVCVRVANLAPEEAAKAFGNVIIAGFGLAGRWVAEIFDRHHINYVIVDENPETVETQRGLGRRTIRGNIADPEILHEAGIQNASILILTIPDDATVLGTITLARQIRPDLYIVARTAHSSTGMQAAQIGADEVIKEEQVVARHFYEMLLRKVTGVNSEAVAE